MATFDTFPKRFPSGMEQTRAVVQTMQDSIIKSYAPPAPFLPRTARIVSMGSCFAEEISKSLAAEGVDVAHVSMSERWNSAFALHRFLLKALHGTPFPPGFILNEFQVDGMQERAAMDFASADLFILTFGLSLCWFERATGNLVLEPKVTPTERGIETATRNYEMRQTAVVENEDVILACINEIKRFNPNARIVLTLSPVPLLATFGGPSVVAANTVSKSTLRVALHAVMAREIAGVLYWPSYECVMWFGAHVMAAFGGKDQDMRHVRPDLVAQIAKLFKAYYFVR